MTTWGFGAFGAQPAAGFGAQPAAGFGQQAAGGGGFVWPQQQQQQQQPAGQINFAGAFGQQQAQPQAQPPPLFGFQAQPAPPQNNLFAAPVAAPTTGFTFPLGGAAAVAAVVPPPAAAAPPLDEQDSLITRFLDAFPKYENGRYAETSSARRPLTHLVSLLDPYRKAGDKGSDKLPGYALRRMLVQFRREEGHGRPPQKLLTDGEWEDALDWKETYTVSPNLVLPLPFTPPAPLVVPLSPMPVEGFSGLLARIELNKRTQSNLHARLEDAEVALHNINMRASKAEREKARAGDLVVTHASFDERIAAVRHRQRSLTQKMLEVCLLTDTLYAKRLRLHESAEEMEMREELQTLLASLNHAENLEMRVQDVRLLLHEQLLVARRLAGAVGGGGSGADALPQDVLTSVDELQQRVNERLRDLQSYNRDLQAAQGAVARMRGCCGARMGGWGMGY